MAQECTNSITPSLSFQNSNRSNAGDGLMAKARSRGGGLRLGGHPFACYFQHVQGGNWITCPFSLPLVDRPQARYGTTTVLCASHSSRGTNGLEDCRLRFVWESPIPAMYFTKSRSDYFLCGCLRKMRTHSNWRTHVPETGSCIKMKSSQQLDNSPSGPKMMRSWNFKF